YLLYSLLVLLSAMFQARVATVYLPSFPTRRSSDLLLHRPGQPGQLPGRLQDGLPGADEADLVHRGPAQVQAGEVVLVADAVVPRSEEHTSELQSRFELVCRLLLAEKIIMIIVKCLL